MICVVSGDGGFGRKKRNAAQVITMQVLVSLEDYDFLENGTYDNDTGNTINNILLQN